LEQAQTISILVGAGVKTVAEARAELGLGQAAGVVKFNPYHNEQGRFTTAEGSVEPGTHLHPRPDRGFEVADNSDHSPTMTDAERQRGTIEIAQMVDPPPPRTIIEEATPPDTPKVEPAPAAEPPISKPPAPNKPESSYPAAPTGGWQPPKLALDKIPSDWGSPVPNKDGQGVRWLDPRGDKFGGIRIDPGDPSSAFPSQRTDHVVVRSNGNVLGRDGAPISGSIKDNAESAHIPLSDWLERFPAELNRPNSQGRRNLILEVR
jgi:hypothetical protein